MRARTGITSHVSDPVVESFRNIWDVQVRPFYDER